MVDLNHMSNDGRMYIAFKTLADNAGLFCYMAVTMGGDADCKWVNSEGKPM